MTRPGIESLPGNERLGVPVHLLQGRPGEHYVLRVVGDSMRTDGILDGDYLVCWRGQPEPGDCAVCLLGDDATLKYVYPEGDEVRLKPSDPALPAICVPAAAVKFQGVVVGMMRKFARRAPDAAL